MTLPSFGWLSALQKEIRRGNEEQALYWAFELVENGFWGQVLSRLKVIAHEDVGTGNLNVLPFVSQCLDDIQAWYSKDSKTVSAKKKNHWILSLTNAILALCRAKKSRDADNLQIVVRSKRKNGMRLEIPDYAYDKHTYNGKKMGRGYKHFFEEGAKLEPDCSNKAYAEAAKEACLSLERGEVEDFFEFKYPEKKKTKHPAREKDDEDEDLFDCMKNTP